MRGLKGLSPDPTPTKLRKLLPPGATSKSGIPDPFKGAYRTGPGAVKKGTKLPPASGEIVQFGGRPYTKNAGATTFIPKSKLGKTLGKAGDKATNIAKDVKDDVKATGSYLKYAVTANADKLAKRWSPYRTIASLYLWKILEGEDFDW